MGRAATISIAKRATIVTLREEGYSVRSIAERVGVSPAAVGKICQRKVNFDTIEPQKQPGRPRKTSKQTDRMIRRQAVANPGATSHEISATIPSDLSTRSIRRRLQECHLNGRRPATRPFLNNVQKRKRVSFSHLHEDKTAEWWMKNVLFSDESMVELHPRRPYYIRRPVSSRHHPRYIYPRYHHPLKVMVWGCFAACGVASIEILRPRETVNSNRYIEILRDHLPVSMAWSETTVFMQDNAPSHTSRATRQWLQENGITILDWPGNSADLNPIENLWSVLKASVRQKNVKNEAELRTVIQEAWESISPTYCANLISSMPERLRQVLHRKGACSSY
jgi:transposase